jgi:hypothetical protein
MKKLKLFAFAVIGLALVSVVSCKKGDAGPAGPAGPVGPAGPDSVIYSQWIPVTTPFVGVDANNDSVYEQVVTASAITQNVLDKDVVLAYIQLSDGTVSDIANFSTVLDVYYGVGTLTIDSYRIDLSQFGWSVRYVIVPGTIAAGNSILKNYTRDQLRSVDYATIAKALGLSNSKATN